METVFFTSLTLPEIKEMLRNEIRNELGAFRENMNTRQSAATSPIDEFTPIDEIFKRRLMSKPTFYEHVKAGKITIHKLGRKSFIRTADYEKLFRPVSVAA